MHANFLPEGTFVLLVYCTPKIHPENKKENSSQEVDT